MVGGENAAQVGAVVARREARSTARRKPVRILCDPGLPNCSSLGLQYGSAAGPGHDSASGRSDHVGGEAVLRKDGKPVVAITFPQDWKQTASDTLASAISPDGQAWAGLSAAIGRSR